MDLKTENNPQENQATNKPQLRSVKKQKKRGRRIEVTGYVLSDKMDKTITVEVYRQIRHPRLGKYIKRSTKFKAHDEKNTASQGDKVLIHATRALSKTKFWKLSKVIEKSQKL